MGEVLGLNTVDNIINSIYIIRGQQVMLDSVQMIHPVIDRLLLLPDKQI